MWNINNGRKHVSSRVIVGAMTDMLCSTSRIAACL